MKLLMAMVQTSDTSQDLEAFLTAIRPFIGESDHVTIAVVDREQGLRNLTFPPRPKDT